MSRSVLLSQLLSSHDPWSSSAITENIEDFVHAKLHLVIQDTSSRQHKWQVTVSLSIAKVHSPELGGSRYMVESVTKPLEALESDKAAAALKLQRPRRLQRASLRNKVSAE